MANNTNNTSCITGTTNSSKSIISRQRRQRRRPRTSSTPVRMSKTSSLQKLPLLLLVILSSPGCLFSFGFTNPSLTTRRSSTINNILSKSNSLSTSQRLPTPTSTPTSLNVWWFGGSEQNEKNKDDESCELVAVRIERPSSNSRRIMGDISIPGVAVNDVWSILTDYDRLSTHVTNLKESRVIRENNKGTRGGVVSLPGDGSYKCQLYQVGAQKIIGFDFSASVTMDMTERILTSSTSNARKIYFKCVDSQFFSEFDGSWTVQEQISSTTGEKEVLCSYDVLVRPKGPVPVAALEWRIREDVPTNLRAVKAATLGMVSTASRKATATTTTSNGFAITTINDEDDASSTKIKTRNGVTAAARMATKRAQQKMAAVMVDWNEDWERGETMAKYLE
jgi:hypothetical protein